MTKNHVQVIQLEAEALRNEEVRRKEENEASTKSKRSSITEQFSKKNKVVVMILAGKVVVAHDL